MPLRRALWPPVHGREVGEPGEGFVDVKRETEAATGLERDG